MNKARMMSTGICIAATCMMVGCGSAKVPDVVNTTSLVITDKGAVISYLVDVFDKDYYSISGLTSMAVSEVAEYNTENQTGETAPVSVEKVEALEDGSGKVVVTYKYDSTDTFMDYNQGILFYGTVSEAVNEGYDLKAALKNVKDDTPLSEAELLKNPERKILITDQMVRIYCPKKVTHISDGAVYASDGSVDASTTEGPVVILMK